MTHEGAIKILTELKPIPVDGFKIIAEAYDLAIDALEKQIPKKPTRTRGKYGHTECACCGWVVESYLWRFGTVSILPKLRTGY